MPLIQIPVGVAPCQVDFPSTVKEGSTSRPFQRSCKGALHFRPASTKEVTEDELRYLKSAKQHAKLGARLFVVEVRKKPPKVVKPKAKPFVPPPPPVPHVPEKKDGKK